MSRISLATLSKLFVIWLVLGLSLLIIIFAWRVQFFVALIVSILLAFLLSKKFVIARYYIEKKRSWLLIGGGVFLFIYVILMSLFAYLGFALCELIKNLGG